MEHKELLTSLNHLKVETGSLACLGCGYEHNCGIHGCAILREAVACITDLEATHRTEMCEDGYDCRELGRARKRAQEAETRAEKAEGVVALLHAAAVQAAEMRGRLADIEDILGDSYDLDRLRELTEAVRLNRMFAFPVVPDLRPGSRISELFILLDSGEVVQDNVYNISIGPNSDGEVVAILSTFDSGDFDADDFGTRIFCNIEDAQRAAAARREGQDA